MNKFVLLNCFITVLLLLNTKSYSQGRNPEEEKHENSVYLALHPEARDGIVFMESENKEFAWWLDGRLYLDGAWYFENTVPLSNGTELRKARLAVKTTLWKNWATELDVDFSDQQVDVKDMWIGYFFNDGHTNIKAGNFKEPFGVETTTSSRYYTFVERAYIREFAPSRHIGIAATSFGRFWWLSGGVFGQEVTDEKEIQKEYGYEMGDEGYAFTGRGVLIPYNKDEKLIHIGGAATYRTTDANGVDDDGNNLAGEVKFDPKAETHISRTEFLHTGDIQKVENMFSFGLEGLACYKRFSLQGEFMQTKLSRTDDLSDLKFNGFYVQTSCFITGEHRPYWKSQAEFGRIIPKNKYGALELAVRYSTIDLNDKEGGVTGGEAENITFGLNWYPNPNFRVMLNYTIVNNDRFANSAGKIQVPQGDTGKAGEDFSFIQIRLLSHF